MGSHHQQKAELVKEQVKAWTVVLFGVTTEERTEETGLSESTLRRASDVFHRQGLFSLIRPTKQERESHLRFLPVMLFLRSGMNDCAQR